MVKFNDGGQGYFDFESLAAKTSQEFADTVRRSYNQKFNVIGYIETDYEHFYQVKVIGVSSVTIYNYFCDSGNFDTLVIGVNDLRDILNVVDGALND